MTYNILTISIPQQDLDLLDKLSKLDNRTKSNFVVTLIRDYAKEKEAKNES